MTSAGDPTIRLVGYEDPSVRALVDEVQQEYVARYGGPDRTPVTAGEFPLGPRRVG